MHWRPLLFTRIAVLENFQVVGTIGILLRAVKSALLTAQESKNFLTELVAEHNFRISTSVYDAACNALFDAGHNSRNPGKA